jgi:diguanylate cyclase (GGDEF)-like protein/PAS domain S-box-containing protein
MAVGGYTVALDRRLGSKPGVSAGAKIGLKVPVLGIFLLAASVVSGQPRSTVFSSIELPGGAAFNRVQVQVQDQAGFMWIATEGGLVHYDGYDARVFRHDPGDPSSLPGNSVTALYIDRSGVLWIGTENNGLARFEPATESFTRFGSPGGSGPLDATVYSLIEDSLGRFWVGGDGGLTYLVDQLPTEPLLKIPTYHLIEAADGTMWAGTEFGVARLDLQTGRFDLVPEAKLEEDNDIGVEVWNMLLDPQGFIWYGGTASGLRRFDPASGQLKVYRHDPDRSDSLINDDVYSLLLDADGLMWVGTYGGLEQFDPVLETINHIPTSVGVPGAISHPYIYHLYLDHRNTLWVGTYGGGINLLPGGSPGYRYFTHDPNDTATLSENRAQTVQVDGDGGVWVGTYENGLNRLDPVTGLVDRYPQLARSKSQQARRIWEMREDQAGRLWVASSEGLLCRLDKDGGFVPLSDAYPELPPLDVDDIWALAVADDGVLWLGTFGAGLYALDPNRSELTHYETGDPIFPGLLDKDITDLTFDADGRLLIGTYWSGLQVFDGKRFDVIEAVSDQFPVTMTMLQPDGVVWVATRGNGLLRLENDQLTARYTAADGLPSNFVEAVGADSQNRIWVTTDNGLAFLLPEADRFHQIRLFARAAGRVYLPGAMDVDAAGNFWVGAQDGLLQFDPSKIDTRIVEPAVVATRLGTRTREISLAYRDPVKPITLDYLDSAISLEFAALQFIQADLIEYAYRLDGVDPDWVPASADNRRASYTNLTPGNYRFSVRARNPGGIWAESSHPLSLIIVPPVWRSTWAYAGYALLLVVLTWVLSQSVGARRRLRGAYHRALREREERLELALWGSGDWMWDWDVPGRRIYCPQMCNYLGQETDGWMELDLFNRAINPQDLQAIIDQSRRNLIDRDDLEHQFRIRDAGGEVHWMVVRGRVVSRTDAGRPLRVTGTCKNIDERKAADHGLRLSARVLENSHDAIAITDLEFRFVQVNRMFEEVTGYSEAEILGQTPDILNSGTNPAEFGEQMRHAVARKGSWRGEIQERRKSGELFYSDLNVSAVKDDTGQITNFVAVFSDVTRKHQTAEELRYLANYDALTGLPNRTLFGERLSHAVVKARRRISRVVVVLVDIDEFKHINESQGHLTADLILKQTADRLTSAMREEDTIARLSADEFAILVEGTESDREVKDLSRVILNAMKAPFSGQGQELRLSSSLGISVYPDNGNDAPTLIQNAQTALSVAKDENRGQARFYADDLRTSALRRIRLSEELDRVLERKELELYYQPKVRSDDRSVCGVEALLRWRHGERGMISPDEFIPLAEQRGQIVAIGEWVLRTACHQIMNLREHGLEPLPVSVNVSPLQLEDGRLVETVKSVLSDNGMDPSLLLLELTESSMLSQVGQAVRTLDEIKSMAVNLVVDDFGTGYSSLSYLNRLPVDQIKIDKTFVKDIEEDRFSRAIVSAVLSMADSLGLRVTAEGIEEDRQFEFLRNAGCQEIQGFLISRPLPYEDLVKFLKAE